MIKELDGSNVDCIVQAGTNLSALDIFPTLEKQLGKPIIPINVATIWHALRAQASMTRSSAKAGCWSASDSASSTGESNE